MLMEAKAFNEGARALILWGALQVDLSPQGADRGRALAADDLISVLTPVIKGYLTDRGFEAAVNAQQVFGGHGYIREWGMEQFVRDARIAQIYEGTNGVQAMDLVGPQARPERRPRVRALFEIDRPRHRRSQGGGRTRRASPSRWKRRCSICRRATMWLAQNGMADPEQCRRRRLCLYAADGFGQPRLDVAQDGRRVRQRLKDEAGEDRRSMRRSSDRAFFATGSWWPRERSAARSRPAPTA